MTAREVTGAPPIRMDRIAGPQLSLSGLQSQLGAPQRQQVQPRMDQLSFSPDSLALYRLTTLWGALSSLFGINSGQQQQPAVPDLSALQEAIMQARQNAQDMQTRQQVTNTLKTSVLAGAEALIKKYYGLSGDGTNVQVSFDQNVQGALAQVTFQYDNSGKIVNPQLHLNMSEFTPDTSSNGTNDHVIQNDRIVAHEMTHLVMGRNMDLAALPDWFAEGTAEYIAGGAERVALSLRVQSPRQLLSQLLQPWDGSSDNYSAGYLAVRFLDQVTADGGGLKAIMARLKAGDSLDQAIATVSQGQYAGADDFITSFATDGSGMAFIRSIDLSGRDAGSIKPGPGPDVVPDTGARSDQPLQGFHLQWPSPLEGLNLNLSQVSWGFGFTTAQAASQAYLRQTGSRGGSIPI